MSVRNHACGFEWGPLNIVRLAHNDGSDKRKKWWAIDIRTPSGSMMMVFDKKGQLIGPLRNDAEPSTSETGSGNDYSTQSGGSLLDGPGEAREIPSE